MTKERIYNKRIAILNNPEKYGYTDITEDIE
jgi:hypothetical protein